MSKAPSIGSNRKDTVRKSIGVLGVSLGASTSILAAADDPDIAAVAADSGYGNLYSVIDKNWTGLSGLPRFLLPGVRLAGKLMYGFDVATVRPIDSIRSISPRPVLLIHGTADSLISVDQAHALKAAYPDANLWIVPEAEHAAAYAANPDEYLRRVSDFFSRSLK